MHYHSRDQERVLNLSILNVFEFNEFFCVKSN